MWVVLTHDGMLHACVSERAAGELGQQSIPREFESFQDRGYVVKKVSYKEYESLSEATDRAERAEIEAKIAAQPSAVPIEVAITDIPPAGLRVRARFGEAFGPDILWQPAEEYVLVREDDCNSAGQRGVNLVPVGSGEAGWGYAGYEKKTKTWWRFRADARGGEDREHCMQVLELL